MFRLLIVDDEELITDGLYEVFSKLDTPELDVCKAYSGREAMDWLHRTRMDIVLTDIKMPGINGLELMERIQADWPHCKIIFLTGYNEFDYVYKAIQKQGVSYLLKTEGYDKVIEKVMEAVRELEQSLRIENLHQRSQELEIALETYLHRDYLWELIAGKTSMASRGSDFEAMRMPLDPHMPVIIAIGQLSASQQDVPYSKKRETLRALNYLVGSFLEDRVRSVCITDRRGDLLLFIQPREGGLPGASNEEIGRFVQGMLELVQKACLESLGVSVVFTMNETPNNWEEAVQSHWCLQQTLWLQIGDGDFMVVTDRLIRDHSNAKPPSRDKLLGQRAELLSGYLASGRRDDFITLLNEFEQEMLAIEADGLDAMETYYTISLALLSNINRWKPANITVDTGRLMRFDDHASCSEAVAYVKEVADSLFKLRQSEERKRAQTVIDRVRSFIDEHLSEDLSLVRLAEQVHFNPSYLSRLFKQECGINLSNYIEDTRIRKAKELLEAGDDKIHEIGSAVGYEVTHSFTRFFKKATGFTPQEYKNAFSNK